MSTVPRPYPRCPSISVQGWPVPVVRSRGNDIDVTLNATVGPFAVADGRHDIRSVLVDFHNLDGITDTFEM
jgi:hypothetical protein